MITLNEHQHSLLLALASGETRQEIAHNQNMSTAQLNRELLDLQARTGAKTSEHLIAKGFAFGFINAKHLCLVLMFTSSINAIDNHAVRPKLRARAATTLRMQMQSKVA